MMADETPKSGDLLGLAPYGEAIKVATQGFVDGTGAFLGRICLPAAEEFGLFLRDRVRSLRANHAVSIAQKAEKLLGEDAKHLHAHPRLVMRIIEDGSWADNEAVQDMWAGLLASSCCPDGRDESSFLFINLLGQLATSEALLLDYSCREAQKVLLPAGWISASKLLREEPELRAVVGFDDFHRLDRELDHLRSLGLLWPQAGFISNSQEKTADITPSTIALQLYARAKGVRGSMEAFFGLVPSPLSGN